MKPQIDPKRDAELRRLAKRIARQLFGDGYGTQSERLVMRHEGRTYDDPGDGLTEKGCAFIVLSHLRRAEIARMKKERI
jgi:hypothetical protein